MGKYRNIGKSAINGVFFLNGGRTISMEVNQQYVGVSSVMGDSPSQHSCFNTKSWSNDFDDLG